jgi:hypothetical protein
MWKAVTSLAIDGLESRDTMAMEHMSKDRPDR